MVAIMADVVMDHLPVATALGGMITVVGLLRLETTTTRATDTAPLLLLEVLLAVRRWTILTLQPVAAIPKIAMAHHLLVVVLKSRMVTGTIGAPDRHLEATAVGTTSVRATGDCFLGLALSGLIAYHCRNLHPRLPVPFTNLRQLLRLWNRSGLWMEFAAMRSWEG